MKTLINFALGEKYKRFSQLDTNLLKLISLVDWKSVRIIFKSMYFNKTVY